jgi:hypothetical protein
MALLAGPFSSAEIIVAKAQQMMQTPAVWQWDSGLRLGCFISAAPHRAL